MKILALLLFSASCLLAETCILRFISSASQEAESRPENSLRIGIQGAGTDKPGIYYLKKQTGLKELISSDIGTHRLTLWKFAEIRRFEEGKEERIKINLKRVKEPEIKKFKLLEGDLLTLYEIPL